jgi:hypothetical protein
MLTRFHKVMIALLAVQIVLAIVMLMRGDDSVAKKAEPLLPGFDAAKVTKIAVYAKPDADGKPADGKPNDAKSADKPSVELVKKNGAWVISSAFDYPAEDSKVADVLSPIAKMAAASPIATQADRFKQLRVDDAAFERKLVLTIDGKDTTLYFGGAAGTRRTAVRLGGDARVFAVAGPSAYSIGDRPRDWVDAKYVEVARDEVAKVSVQRGDTTIALARDGDHFTALIDGAPLAVAKDQTIDTAAIDSAVGDVTNVDLAAPGDPKRDASKPTATITIERKAPTPIANDGSGSAGSGSAAAPTPAAPPPPIVLDVIADGDNYWLHDRSKPTAVAVDKSRLKNLVELDHDKLVKKVEAAKPKTGTAPGMPNMPSPFSQPVE